MEPQLQPLFDYVFDPSFNGWVLELVSYEDAEPQQQLVLSDEEVDDDVF